MYKTYTTDAIVCGSKIRNTSDKAYLLFTKEAGMLWASARSVREERSRQRCALQEFSIIRVSLVSGKSGWKIGSVEAIANPFMEASNREVRGGLRNVVRLLRRFLHGEVPHPTLFEDVLLALSCIGRGTGADGKELEALFTLRMLYTLGYIAPHVSYTDLLSSDDPWLVPTQIPQKAHEAIEQALSVSHL